MPCGADICWWTGPTLPLNMAAGVPGPGPGYIKRLARGGSPTTIAQAPRLPWSLVFDGTDFFETVGCDICDGTLVRIPASGGASVSMGSGSYVTVDDTCAFSGPRGPASRARSSRIRPAVDRFPAGKRASQTIALTAPTEAASASRSVRKESAARRSLDQRISGARSTTTGADPARRSAPARTPNVGPVNTSQLRTPEGHHQYVSAARRRQHHEPLAQFRRDGPLGSRHMARRGRRHHRDAAFQHHRLHTPGETKTFTGSALTSGTVQGKATQAGLTVTKVRLTYRRRRASQGRARCRDFAARARHTPARRRGRFSGRCWLGSAGTHFAPISPVLRMGFLRTPCLLFAILTPAACGTKSGGGTPDGNDGAPDVTRCIGAYINNGDPCTTEGSSCTECEEGVGIGCACSRGPNDGGNSAQWLCVGTGHVCPWM